jgi:predicted DNA-binding antitoxin AbrB/MazE fold protein
MVIQAVYENGVFRPLDPIELPEHSQVELVIHQPAQANSHASVSTAPLADLAAIAGAHPKNPDLPVDLAEQHDHYLYGTPKRP